MGWKSIAVTSSFVVYQPSILPVLQQLTNEYHAGTDADDDDDGHGPPPLTRSSLPTPHLLLSNKSNCLGSLIINLPLAARSCCWLLLLLLLLLLFCCCCRLFAA